MSATTATSQLLAALRHGERITQLDATARWGITRLASLVHNLRRKGYPIITITHEAANGSRYAEYQMRTS
ncbi:helix-turn-helix domain-containing protein [Mameliella sp.]|uniref:helix-turn-helix domain-containing protein n=1 Tax=Mameliella sp. TaxID=1924940 RepID=UPI003BABBF17